MYNKQNCIEGARLTDWPDLAAIYSYVTESCLSVSEVWKCERRKFMVRTIMVLYKLLLSAYF